MESKSCEDDIDALLSAAGTFVRDAKTTSSSVVGSHLAGCTSTQSMQGNVDVPLHDMKQTCSASKISWITSAQEEIGTFFVNKPNIGQDSSNSTSRILPASCTSVCSLSFEELVVKDGLLAAVLTPGCSLQLSVKDHFIEHFPQTTQLELVIKKSEADSASTDYVMLCPECPQTVTNADESSVLQCLSCRLARVHYFDDNLLRAKFMLLRYIDKVKFIVLSAPLSRVHWHQAIQLGWFCHFPIVPDSDETCNNERKTAFQASLSTFLQSLGLNAETLLHGVDFSQLSPAVNLICTIPGKYSHTEGSQHGVLAVCQLMKQFPSLHDSRKQSVYCTTRLGNRRNVPIVQKLFGRSNSHKKRHQGGDLFKIIFPSAQRMQNCLRSFDATDAQMLSDSFENNDRKDLLRNHCYNLHDQSVNLLYHFNMAFQYQLCRANDLNEGVKWYGWMVIGSQSAGVGSWGDIDDSLRHVSYYLYHLGIALFPYVTSAEETVHAVNLASLCPFSLSSLIAYQKYERPHVHPPPRRATSAKQTDTAVESTQHFTVPRGTGLSSDSRRESATESVWNLRIPVNGASDGMDEDEMLNACQKGAVERLAELFPTPTREELEAITMEPTRIVMDQNWLASHVRGVCGGQMPPLVGPYAVPYLVAQLEGMRKHFIEDDDSVC